MRRIRDALAQSSEKAHEVSLETIGLTIHDGALSDTKWMQFEGLT